ncbi:predicted protein [Nematostella vectensis]|uniref:DNA helicase n=1 Tax=Nematostella vectensis TaxID=45351 RepID=A7SS04_NEMVE|nr:predicted protein [Nematostella vectensis]|eukprot:XP_001625621.1 predicted protein [Nematostella vectensis]
MAAVQSSTGLHLEQYILETTGETVNLLEDSNARFKAVQENTHLVVSYFDMHTRSYHENVVRPVFGVSDYWYRYEFAESRSQIHWHQLSWREDRQPHELLHQAVQEECQKPEKVRRLNEWVEDNFAISASNPACKDEDGEPRKEFWLPPEGTAEPVSEDDDPLGSRRLERNWDTATSSTALDKYLARPCDQCPMFVEAIVVNASRQAEGAREPTYESDGEDEPADAEEQPDWVDNYTGPNQTYESVKEFQYDDGAEDFDWSSSTIVIPETADPKVWLVNQIEENDYTPLRLVVSGTGGTGKSYMIKCIQRLVQQLFGYYSSQLSILTDWWESVQRTHGAAGNALRTLQENCKNLAVLIGDERSMVGRTMLGWMEQHMRYGINKGTTSEQLWGGIPVVVLMSPTPTYIPDSRNAPSNHGRLVWTMFDSAAELTQTIRQAESERQLRDADVTANIHNHYRAEWMKKVFSSFLQWGRNKTKILECNSLPGHPVAKIKAENHGHHAQKADSNKAGSLLPRLCLYRDSKVMLVANLKATWGLFNGAVGRVVDIVYLNGRRQTDDPPPLPDYVMVHTCPGSLETGMGDDDPQMPRYDGRGRGTIQVRCDSPWYICKLLSLLLDVPAIATSKLEKGSQNREN